MLNQSTPHETSAADRESVEDLCSREVAEHLVRIADLLPGVIYALRRTPGGTYSIPYASAALEQMFGFEPGELSAEPSRVFTRVVDEDLAPLLASIDASAASLSVWGFEFRIEHPDLGLRTILGKSTPERDREGNTTWFGFATDVTDSLASAAESRRRKRLLEAVISNSPSLLSIKDLQGRYVLANPNLQAFLGRTEAAILGTTIFDHFDAETARRIAANDAQVVATNQRISFEERVVVDGAEVVFASFKFPIPDAQGAPEHICSISHDITARKRAEVALRTSEEAYRTLLDSMGDGVFVTQQDGIAFANPALASMLGYSSEELARMPFAHVVAPESLAMWQDAHQRALHHGDSTTVSLDLVAKDGASRVSVELRARSVSYLTQPGVLGIVRDTGARLRSDAALRESESRFRQLTENLREVFWLTDVSKEQLLYLSPGYQNIWGRTVASVMESPQSWMEAIHPEDRPRVEAAARQR